MGRHRRNQLCNHCGKAEGSCRGDEDERVSLLLDLEEYADEDRVFQAPRSPENPLPQFLTWCFSCARQIAMAGDPIENFREFGFPDNSPDGPYARWLAANRRGFSWNRSRSPRK